MRPPEANSVAGQEPNALCLQVFGKDSFLTLGRETEESRKAWADDADDQVMRCSQTPPQMRLDAAKQPVDTFAHTFALSTASGSAGCARCG